MVKIKIGKKFLIVFWASFFLFWLGFLILMVLINYGFFGELPSVEEIEDPEKNLASEVISYDGEVLGKYYKENRSLVKYDEISDNLINSLIATEDERFFKHSGIDVYSFFRAIVFFGKKGGASTITQQLAKMYFTERPSRNIFIRIIQKLKEWIIAIKLERQYTKEEIIEMYLNKFDFLYLAVGINSASKIYFNKSPKDLDIEESAVLVGMAKNPSLYNPRKFPENAVKRRNVVYNQMYKNGFINEVQLDTLSKRSITLNFTPESHDEGLATYFREHLRNELKVWIKNNPKIDGTYYSLEKDGLKIYTTIDSRMQEYAEQAVREHIINVQKVFNFVTMESFKELYPFVTPEERDIIMNQAIRDLPQYKNMKKEERDELYIDSVLNIKKKMTVFSLEDGTRDTIFSTIDSIRYYKSLLHAGILSIEPQTGFIKTWVGGVDYKQFKYDNVFQMKRQVGSTFKPFVYGTAIDQLKMSPCDKLPNTNIVFTKEKWGIPEEWSPKNADDKIDGKMYTLTQALAISINTITARVVEKIGSTEPIRRFVKRLGVNSYISSGPAMSLGTSDMSLYEMVGAYSTFVNKGIHISPMFLLRIEDKNGIVLANFKPEIQEAMSEESAYVITKLLEGVVNYGSGVRLKTTGGNYSVWGNPSMNFCTGYPYGFTNSIAGKTGTTQNQSDGWFIGMVPNLATGVWVGHDTRAVHFDQLYYGQGASTALPIWGIFMRKCYEDETLEISKSEFEKPKEKLSIEIDCKKLNEEKKSERYDLYEEEF